MPTMYKSYGIDKNGNAFLVIDPRNTRVNAAVTLLASAWVDGKQNVDIEIMTASVDGEAYLAQDVTAEQIEAATAAILHVTNQGEGYVEITAFGDVPEIDIPIVVKVVG